MLRLALLAVVSTLLLAVAPVRAADDDSGWADTQTAGAGNQGSQNGSTWGNQYGGSMKTTNQRDNPIDPLNLRFTGTGMPIPGTHLAIGNLALQTEHRNPFGGMLPITNLDSFVAQSGYNDFIYGDEGTEGPPPYSSFGTIGSGGVSATTGHQSDCPSAWY